MIKKFIFILCLLPGFSAIDAQSFISLQAAIDSAFKNNLNVKNEKLIAAYQDKLKGTTRTIPNTEIMGEYGQINSAYSDTRFEISQSISYPTIYTKQKDLQNEIYKSSVLNIAFKEADLKKQVSQVFYLLVYLQQKQKLLLQTDSVYTTFLEKAALRYAKGENNILEKTTAETQRGQILIQLNQLKSDMDTLLLQFHWLLNASTRYIPYSENLKMILIVAADTTIINSHPQLLVLQQQKNISSAYTQVEKSKLLPDLHIGFSSQSIKGNGADNIFYNKSTRFNAIQFGVGLPIFIGAQKERINSSKIMETISENNYQIGLHSLKTEYQTTFRQYQTKFQTVQYFEETALQNAKVIVETADRQFSYGDINYLEWTMLINNATAIQSNYIDAVKELNQSIIHLHYLNSK